MPSPLYHGTRASYGAGDECRPGASTLYVYCSPTLDDAVWAAELAPGDTPPRVYVVEVTGPLEDASTLPEWSHPGHPSMTWRATMPVRVLREVTEWRYYHGTRAALELGDLIAPGFEANHGAPGRIANYVYFARTLDAATWGAELALGDGAPRIYLVEPTGPIEDDPNVTNRKFRGNPTKSFRSRHPLRVLGEVTPWVGHPPAMLQAMREGLARLAQSGEATIDD